MKFVRVQSREELLGLLEMYDASATRRITERVRNLKDYSGKLYTFAENYVIYEEKEPIGFFSFYANDDNTKQGYLTLIALKGAWQGKGAGSRALLFICEECKKRQMKEIRLEVDKNNQRAVSFYRNNGFAVGGEASRESFYMEKEI